jgi:predicted transcriptional regulator
MLIRVREPDEDIWKDLKGSFTRAWETGEYQGEEITFASLDQLLDTFTPKRWEIIAKLRKIGPSSLRGLAREVHRDVKRVHEDVAVLLKEGVVERTSAGKLEVPFVSVRFKATIGEV